MIKTEEQKKNYEAIKAKDSTFKEIYSKKYLAIPIPEGNSNDIPQIDCLLAEGPEVDDRIRKLTTEKVLTDDEIIMFVNLRKEIPHNDMAKIEAIFLMLPDNKARMEYLRKISDKNKYITMTKAGNIANKYEFSENQEIKMRIAADILNKTFKIPPPNPDI